MKLIHRLSVAALLALSSSLVLAASAVPVKKLPSGVVVETTRAGTGARPTADNAVSVHYRGTLENGKEFDSSYSRGQPATFALRRVVPCWTEGIQQLTVGAKAKLTCPADTAYGPRGIPGVIPGNATLTFEVELLAVQ